jgi:hypothetical protein
MSVFDNYRTIAWPHRFHGRLVVDTIAGGTPSDPKVTEGWLRTKLADKDDLLRDRVNETMFERGMSEDEAVELVDAQRHLNGFKRDEHGLYIDGRCLKAALKEAASIAANAGKLSTKGWGNPDNATWKKGLKGWFPEHVFVLEDRLHLGVHEASAVVQRFVHTHRGSAIQYEEIVEKADISFTVVTDYDFSEKEWAMLWLTGEQQGIGAARSQGCGRYAVVEWEEM